MNCAHCGRSLKAFAVSIQTASGVYGWGPKCARAVFKAQRRARAAAARARQAEPDPRQRDWVSEAWTG